MATQGKRVASRWCPCGQILSDERYAEGWRRCVWCIERFGKAPVAGKARPAQQGALLQPAVAPVGVTPIREVHQRVPPPPAPPLEVPAGPTEAQRTAEVARKLREAKERADSDTQLRDYLAARAAGVPRDRLLENDRKKGNDQ